MVHFFLGKIGQAKRGMRGRILRSLAGAVPISFRRIDARKGTGSFAILRRRTHPFVHINHRRANIQFTKFSEFESQSCVLFVP